MCATVCLLINEMRPFDGVASRTHANMSLFVSSVSWSRVFIVHTNGNTCTVRGAELMLDETLAVWSEMLGNIFWIVVCVFARSRIERICITHHNTLRTTAKHQPTDCLDDFANEAKNRFS